MRVLMFVMPLILGACTPRPGATPVHAEGLPERYDASQAPVPEVASSLKTLFPSRELRSLIDRALRQNPDLSASYARLEEAGFNLARTRAALYPTLTANGGASRSDFGTRSDQFSTTLDAQWELDVWCRIRAGVTAASRDQAAAAADYASARQSIAAQTAQSYFDLVSASQLMALAERSLASFESTLGRVDRRFERGLTGLGDVDLARTDVENTRALLESRRDQRDQAARRLATLVGVYPNASRRAVDFPSLARSISAGVPSTILMKRPDIDAAYQRIRAADARVQVAHADLYPRFSLTTSGGRQSTSLSDLARSNFNVWSFGANVAAPLFDGGLRRSERDAASARARQAFANYRSIVLNALREVEDALGSERYLAAQEAATERALKAAQNAERTFARNYESGLLGLLGLLETQRRSFNTEESLINIRALRYQNRVSLALALGKAL